MPADSAPLPRCAASDFAMQAVLHTGKQVQVTRAVRLADQQPVVLKSLLPEAQTPSAVARMRYEYRVLMQVHGAAHPQLPTPLGLIEEHATVAIAMEDVGGTALRSLLAQQRLNLSDALHVGLQVAQAVGHLHRRQAMHRDINPNNVVFNPATRRVQLIDFDLASLMRHEAAAATDVRALEGTLESMSPEQTGRMDRSVDYRTDFYSLGALLYELLAGRPVFALADSAGDADALLYAILAKEPAPLQQLAPDVPPMLAAVVHRLLAKVLEDRYTSAHGIVADLEACAAQLSSGRRDAFALGAQDRDEQFSAPQKLYGRDDELARLWDAYARACSGQTAFVWISGGSGMGKSALAHALLRHLPERRGIFAAGKHDQLRRHLPFSALAQAVGSVVRRLMSEPEAAVQAWQRRLREALGRSGAALLEVVPSVAALTGPMPPVATMSGPEGEARLLYLMQRLLHALSREQPLVLFLDDLQWADYGTLKLLKHLAAQEYAGAGLLMVGALRDNEVSAEHPLDALRKSEGRAGALAVHLQVRPMKMAEVAALLADATHASPTTALPLAELVQQKTGGNAFFVHEFLRTLRDKDLLAYNAQEHVWTWDLAALQRVTVSDYMAAVLSERLGALAADTQAALAMAACIGDEIELDLLCALNACARPAMLARLQAPLLSGILLPQQSNHRYAEDLSVQVSYRFAHDRLQKAAYELLPAAQAQAIHWAIAQGLRARSAADLTIADHAVAGQALIPAAQRLGYARICFEAAKQAARAMAYAAAAASLQGALQLLPEDAWKSEPTLMRAVQLRLADVEHLQGRAADAEARLNLILEHSETAVEQAEVHAARLEILTFSARHLRGIEAGLDGLRAMGLRLPRNPTVLHVGVAMVKMRWAMRGKSALDLAQGAQMADPSKVRMTHMLLRLMVPSTLAQPLMGALAALNACRLIALYGIIPSTDPFIALLFISTKLNDYPAAEQWRAGMHAVTARFGENLLPAAAIAFVEAGYLDHLQRASTAYLEQIGDAVNISRLAGDLIMGDHCLQLGAIIRSYCSVPDCQQALLRDADAMHPARVDGEGLRAVHQWTLCMQGATRGPASLDTDTYRAGDIFPTMASDSLRAILRHQELLAALVHQDLPAAMAAARAAQRCDLFAVNAEATVVFFAFHAALAHTQARVGLRSGLFRACYAKLRVVGGASTLLAGMQTLINAERLALAGRVVPAIRRYELALAQLSKSSYVSLHALGQEAYARFCLAQGFDAAAASALTRAQDAYASWGAVHKVQLLERELAGLARRFERSGLVGSVKGRDTSQASTHKQSHGNQPVWNSHEAAALIEAALALSGEVQREQLVARVLTTVQQVAGATRVTLWTHQRGVLLRVGDTKPDAPAPEEVARFVLRTQETLTLHDVANEAAQLNLPVTHAKAVLCAPLLQQSKVAAVVYLENDLATDTFGDKQRAMVETLGAQVVTALQNAELVANLERAVEQATADLKQAHEHMLQMEKQSTEMQMAGGFAHEMGNALGAAEYPLLTAYDPDAADGPPTLMAELRGHLQALAQDTATHAEAERAPLAHDTLAHAEADRAPLAHGTSAHAEAERARALLALHDDLTQVFQAVHAGLRRGLSMTARVLEYAQVGDLIAPDATAHAAAVVQQVLQELQGRLEQHAVQVQVDISPEAQLGMSPAHAATVLRCLIANADDALAARQSGPRTLMVRAGLHAGQVEVSVEDNGVGMAPAVQQRVFQPFYSTKGARGAGLALGFCRKLLRVYGGNLAFDSTPDQGSTFRVSLPRR